MKKKLVLINACSLLCVGVAAFAATAFATNNKSRAVGTGDYYSITINAEDVTTSTSSISGSCIVHTDQLDNNITFNYESLKFEQVGEDKYLVFGEDAWFGNDNNSQIRSIDHFTVYGDGGAFTYDYGWTVKTGSIQYTGKDHSSNANGSDVSLGNNQPNYFALMHRSGQADAKISRIVFTYSKECTAGVQPIELDHITLSGQTTSLKKGGAFSFGGTVTATYSNGSTANVTSSTTFSGYNMSARGSYTVKASYTENSITKTATYTLAVKDWVQVWSGSASSSTYSSGGDIWTNVSLTGSQTLRFTFTMSASTSSSGYIVKYYNNNGITWSSLTKTKPSSPFQTTVNLNNSSVSGILGVGVGDSSSGKRGVYIFWNKSNKKFAINNYYVEGSAAASLSLTVTKIERYY